MSSAEMDHRPVRLALGLTIAGASMLATGVAIWLLTAVGRVTSGPPARDLRLAALALLAGGVACGVVMGFGLAAAGRARTGGEPVPSGAGGLTGEGPGTPVPVPSLAEPRSLMNPPPPSPPPLAPPRPLGARRPGEPAAGDREPAARVWWRAAHSPASSGDGTSEEWLRSLRGPAIQQPPPPSAE